MDNLDENIELDSPLLPNTVCIGNYDFAGTGEGDLGFKVGEKLTIVEASDQMFWYVARNGHGQIGLVPITFIDKIPADAPPLPSKPVDAPPLPSKPFHFKTNGITPLPDMPPPLPSKPPLSSKPPLPSKPPLLLIPPIVSSPVSPSIPPVIPEYLQIRDPDPPSVPPPRPERKIKASTLPRLNASSITPSVTMKTSPSLDYIDERPPMPLPQDLTTPIKKKLAACPIRAGKYPTIQAFKLESGWFRPGPDLIICKKLNISPQVFVAIGSAIYLFQHKYIPNIQYLKSSLTLHKDMISLLNNLYEKKEENLNNLEKELRFNSPNADQWNVSFWKCHHEKLSFLLSKLIVRLRTLPPTGINERLEFTSRKQFYSFCEWYTEYRQGKVVDDC